MYYYDLFFIRIKRVDWVVFLKVFIRFRFKYIEIEYINIFSNFVLV